MYYNFMEPDVFLNYVNEAVEGLPSEFKEKLDNVSIFVEDYPTPSQTKKLAIREGKMYLLGLYEGIPQTHRGSYGVGGALPDKITIFKYPILSISQNEEELVDQIQSTVLHEIGHHFGMNEKEIRAAEEARRKKRHALKNRVK
jgi:predicted Zn-dependent protease with MMP-like domain